MLFLNTLKWQKPLQQDAQKLQESIAIKSKLQALNAGASIAEEMKLSRELLFDFYMQEADNAFDASSISRVFDYRNAMENDYPELNESQTGTKYLELLSTIDKIWQYTQAPVSELVNSGRTELIKVNEAATYANFRANAAKMPELFADTKLLVDSFLNLEILTTLIDISWEEKKSIDAQLLDLAIVELRNFAGRGLRFGFWYRDENISIPLLENLNIDSFVLPQ